MLQIRVLGPLELVNETTPDGTTLEIGSPRHREVLAALVVDMGYVVSTDALFERVWSGGRGATGANLHAVISRLRGRLRDSDLTIATVAPGYRLGGPRDAVDALVFTDLMAAARHAITSGDPAAARLQVGQALALWRGSAYADIALPFAETESARLAAQRLAAEELAARLDLDLGHHVELAETLPSLVAEHPVHEALRGQLMLALYRSGRQVEALDVFEQGKQILLDELGLDPGPQLQALHQSILRQDPDLDQVADSRPAEVAARPSSAAPASAVIREMALPPEQLIGRDREIGYVSSLAREPGLLTLTGVGGVGKTTLVSAVTPLIAPDFADGAVYVPLAAVTSPDLVVPAIGRAVGLTSTEGFDPLGALIEHLRGLHLLVVIDNVEHLVAAASDLAAVIAACPQITMLVTSRAPLRVRGESEYQVQPLLLPPEDDVTVEAVAQSGAGALFTRHAKRVSPGFELTPAVAVTAATICHRLGGIPLAIELAAAKLRVLGPAGLLERLDVLLEHAGARDLPRRQRTMRATIDWSYELLGADEQALFRRLAVFMGGFDLAAAETVGAGPGVLVQLEALVEQSLLIAESRGSDIRFRMLEPVRQYAAALLEADEEVVDVRDAHLRHYRALAEAMLPHYRGPRTMEALDIAQLEQGNVNAALDWAVASGQISEAARLAWAMWLFWWLRARLVQGLRSMTGVLSLDPVGEDRVRCLSVRAVLAFAQGDIAAALDDWREGATLARELGFDEGLAMCVGGQGIGALAGGDLAVAEQLFRECIPHAERAGEVAVWMWTLSHVWLGTICLLRGAPQEADALARKALAAGQARGDRLAMYISLFTAAQAALVQGEVAQSRADLSEGIRLSVETGDASNLAYFLDALVVVEARSGGAIDHARGAKLSGAAAGLRENIGGNVYGYYQPDVELQAAVVAEAQDALGRDDYEAAWHSGRQLDVLGAAELALGEGVVLPN